MIGEEKKFPNEANEQNWKRKDKVARVPSPLARTPRRASVRLRASARPGASRPTMVRLTRDGSPPEDPRSRLSDATRAPRIARRRAPFVPPSLSYAEARTSRRAGSRLSLTPPVCASRVVAPHSMPPPRPVVQGDEDPTEKFSLELETKQLGELQESRDELLSRVSHLKRDLQDWRFKLDTQVKSYRSELGDLRKTLNTEVTQLRDEFADLRQTLKQQLEATAEMAAEEKEEEEEA